MDIISALNENPIVAMLMSNMFGGENAIAVLGTVPRWAMVLAVVVWLVWRSNATTACYSRIVQRHERMISYLAKSTVSAGTHHVFNEDSGEDRLIDELIKLGADQQNIKCVRTRIKWHENADGIELYTIRTEHIAPPDVRMYLPRERIYVEFSNSTTEVSTAAIVSIRRQVKLIAYGMHGGARIDRFIAERLRQLNERTEQETCAEHDTPRIWKPCVLNSGRVAYKRYNAQPGYKLTLALCPSKELTNLRNRIAQTNDPATQTATGAPSKRTLNTLLHGMPGTGKSTLVKAVAAEAGNRHILIVDLSLYENDPSGLSALLLNGSFDAINDSDPNTVSHIQLPLNRIVFSIDECDKHMHLLRRDGDPPRVDLRTSALVHGAVKMDARDMDAYVSKCASRLNFHTLLEILDGIIDAPGRIIIATTNNPEAIDPALCRPSRLRKLEMGCLVEEQLTYILESFGFSETDAAHMARELASQPPTLDEVINAMRSRPQDDPEDPVKTIREMVARRASTPPTTS